MVPLLAGLLVLAPPVVDDSNGVPAQLLAKLTRGVNVTRWFCYLPDPVPAGHFDNYFTAEDYAKLRDLGVKYVRLCIAPPAIYRDGKPDADVLNRVDRAVSALARNHAVIWDLHDNGQLKLDAPGQDNSKFVEFWKSIATHYNGRGYNALVFELVNEPVFQKNPAAWYALQDQTVKAIRAIDPKRTILVSGTGWSGIDALASMKPLAEKNLIYTFHCYDPFMFTHQGATWTGPQQKETHGLPYPSSPAAVAKIVEENPSQHRGAIKWYGDQKYDRAYLLSRIKKATDWGHVHHVPTLLGEFGAYPPVSPPDSRRRWFTDMRSIIDELKVPNAIWGYDDGLGLGRSIGANGKVKLDPDTLKSFYGK